jgi:hypothetical protein
MGLRELSIFAFALKEHWVGGTIVGILFGLVPVLVWGVNMLMPHREVHRAALLIAFLQATVAWIKRHKYALMSNAILCGVISSSFLAYVDIERELTNPITISFDYRNELPFMQPDNSGTLWIRVAANNSSAKDVLCRVYLNRLERIGEPKPLWSAEKLQLLWAGTEYESTGNTDRTIPIGDRRIFNIAYIGKGASELFIQSQQFASQVSEKLTPGIYKFTVQANHSTCRSDPIEIVVKYEGQQSASFVTGQSGGR